jgi:ATP-dependent DNA helicase
VSTDLTHFSIAPLNVCWDQDQRKNLQLLNFLVQKSTVYATIIGQRIEEQRDARAKKAERDEKAAAKGKPVNAARKRKRPEEDGILDVDKSKVDAMAANKRAKMEDGSVEVHNDATANTEENEEEFQAQSSLITGAQLRDYQLAGVQWLTTLHANGLNGILGTSTHSGYIQSCLTLSPR